MLQVSLTLWGTLCVQHGDSECSDNHVGCTGAGLYKKGTGEDLQTGVRGPSINLTGCRSCQEYERMLWSMLLSGRAPRCAHTASVPPSTSRAPGPGRTASLCPPPRLRLEPQGSSVRLYPDQLRTNRERERERDGGDAEAQRSHQTVCLTVPRGNQFNSPWLLASRGGGGGRAGKRCTCLREEEEGRGGCYCLFGQKGNLIKLN